jgi:HSP20 family molecular chaperone IbpA
MTELEKTLEMEKEEITTPEGAERTRECQCFVPRSDIYELDDQVIIVADVPGVSEKSVEITLEKDILTINAYVEPVEWEGYSLSYAEYGIGDFQRSFRLPDQIDRENIEAVLKDGVLRLFLPKAAQAKSRKIEVKAA